MPVDATSQELLDHAGSAVYLHTSQPRETILNYVYLSFLFSNAARYLQHLAYGDDSTKTNIWSVPFPFLF